MKTCLQCSQQFRVLPEDQAFYARMNVPEPTLCPDCRSQRRMAFRNERNLFRRPCDLCHKSFLATYPTPSTFPVYCHECWWGEKWDALQYGRDFDFNKPFFHQYAELIHAVPRLGISTAFCENCEYTNFVNYSRNSYLTFGCHRVQDSAYSWRIHFSENCLDCAQVDKGRICYECIDCDDCYHLFFGQDCSHCHDSAFLYDCLNCRECLFCVGLRNAEYCIFNRQYSQQEYASEKQKWDFSSYLGKEQAIKRFSEFLTTQPRRSVFLQQSENVVGDHVIQSKNIFYGFHLKNVEDGRYVEYCEDLKDGMDCTFCGWPAELIYEGISAGCDRGYNNIFCNTTWSCRNVMYCDNSHHSQDLFGCCGATNHKQYCILNKKYTKTEYLKLIPKIMEHMRQTGEWGEFFPMELSPFAYNESIAQDHFPLSQQEVLKRKWRWKEVVEHEFPPDVRELSADILPDDIVEVSDDILHQVVECKESGRLFKIQKTELEFYRKMNLPLPRFHPDVRHKRRMLLRNPRKLWERNCDKCGKTVQATYSPERPETVYCEECYLAAVY